MSIVICLLLLYSFLAMLFDLVTDRIPNYLVAAELIVGFAYQLYIFGPMGILSFLGGIAVPFALSYVLSAFTVGPFQVRCKSVDTPSMEANPKRRENEGRTKVK